MAVNLKNAHPQLSGDIYEGIRCVIHHLLDDLLHEEITEPNNLRLANNLAERQIRPSVLQRKISAGNRSERGAEIHATLLSIFATATQQDVPFLGVARQALQSPDIQMLELPPARPP